MSWTQVTIVALGCGLFCGHPFKALGLWLIIAGLVLFK